jgi:hypothetical protein
MAEMSEGAPAPVEVLPDVPDEPEPKGDEPDVPPPNGEVDPPDPPDPDEPDDPDEPEPEVALVALAVEPWIGHTTWPRAMPPTTATRSTTAAIPATRPRRLGAGGGV